MNPDAGRGPAAQDASTGRLSRRGGIPAQERELGAQGRQTMRRLLDAGMAEFDQNGLQAVRVDDIVRRARTSHGTFYLYFKNKEDLFRVHDVAAARQALAAVTLLRCGSAWNASD